MRAYIEAHSIDWLQDGRICEAVAWEVGPSQRHCIPDLIVSHTVKRHLPGAEVQGFASSLDWALQQAGTTLDDQVTARRCAIAYHIFLYTGKFASACIPATKRCFSLQRFLMQACIAEGCASSEQLLNLLSKVSRAFPHSIADEQANRRRDRQAWKAAAQLE